MAERNKHNLSPEARQARLEYNREYQQKWRAEHPDHDQQWRDANRDKVREAQKKYRLKRNENNPEYNRDYLRQFHKDNPEKQAEYDRSKWERKAQQMENIVNVTENKVIVTDEPGQKICEICGGFFKPERSTAVYCGDRCRQRAHRARKKPLS